MLLVVEVELFLSAAMIGKDDDEASRLPLQQQLLPLERNDGRRRSLAFKGTEEANIFAKTRELINQLQLSGS